MYCNHALTIQAMVYAKEKQFNIHIDIWHHLEFAVVRLVSNPQYKQVSDWKPIAAAFIDNLFEAEWIKTYGKWLAFVKFPVEVMYHILLGILKLKKCIQECDFCTKWTLQAWILPGKWKQRQLERNATIVEFLYNFHIERRLNTTELMQAWYSSITSTNWNHIVKQCLLLKFL